VLPDKIAHLTKKLNNTVELQATITFKVKYI